MVYMLRPLILVSNRLEAKENCQENSAPRLDYLEITRRLEGELAGYNVSSGLWYQRMRRVEKRLKLDMIESVLAARRSAQHNVIISMSEKMALPLAALLQLTRQRPPHVVIAHKLSTGLKTRLFQAWPLHKTFAHIICVCQAQADYAVEKLGLPRHQVSFVYDKVDHRFFNPANNKPGDYVLAVGQEQRDYETLLAALAGTNIRLIVVASSPWSTSRVQTHQNSQIQVLSHIPYTQLRDLYAGARLVAVPLFPVDYAAGVNGLLEGMAMAKPVIVSRTRGISDYVVDGETGVYVTPGAVSELRAAICSLWESPEESRRLGSNARQVVEEQMNLDIYVNRVVQIVAAATTGE